VSDYMVEEADDGFVIPLAGFTCAEARGDDLILRSPDGRDEAWVSAGIEAEVMSELVAREARVERAFATGDSTLQLAFENGVSVDRPAVDDAEAWEVRGPRHVLVVALPGGGEPAIWDSSSEIRRILPGDPLPANLFRMIDSFGFPIPTGEFELRCSSGTRECFELHPPNAPLVGRSDIVRFYDTD
jgi:hypothetical protein